MTPYGRCETAEERRAVLERLLAVWDRNPAMRLAQVIGNVFPGDIYMVEDENLIGPIEVFYGQRNRRDS